ncbi:MAG: 5'/3'-nucleotidase SurE [Christensenellaceae bacterium]|jgi:5'-nucleotidase|nr:5'/3'-nucleotidase SurE [Christensenellaceae bacterium]
MQILLVNDDGYFSEGITKLANALIGLGHTLVVVAPDRCCSGMGHAETFRKPIFVKRLHNYEWECYSISGTPCDSVLIGIELMSKKPPNLIISGLNNGTNLGTEIVYSGTVNAAIEGAIRGYRSIALSAEILNPGDYDYIINIFVTNFELYLKMLDKTIAININYHGTSTSHRGHKIARSGKRNYDERYTVTQDSDGYVFVLDGMPIEDPRLDVDTTLFDNGYITITPLACEFTDFQNLANLENILRGLN